VHFIAASGTNIVVLMGALWLVGRMAGLDKRRCVWLMIAAIVFYGLVAEPRPPILRACVMGLMFCAALWLQRASSSLNWICAAAIILCMIDPMWVFDIGFQLSFAAVMGVAYLAPAFWHGGAEFYWWIREVALGDQYARADQRLRSVAEKFSPVGSGMRFREFSLRTIRFVLLVFVVSAGAWLCAFPITANWFQQVQTWGVISTVLVYPLMSIVMVLSIIKMGLAAFSPTLASALTGILGVVDSFLIRIVEWLAALPAASPTVQAFPFWLTTGFYLWLLAIALTFRKTRSTIPFAGEDSFEGNTTNARNSKQWLVASTVLLALSTVAWRAEQSIAKTPRLTVTVLAVGAGTAIVAELPDNETILYDAGSLGVGGIGRNVIAPFLRHRGISRVDRLYISHPHLDHFNGIPDLAEQIPIGSIVWNECFEQFAGRFSPTKALMKHLSNLGVHVETMSSFDRSWNVGDVEFELQWPPADRCRDLSANDSSTVLQVSYLGHSILLTGDIDETAQRALIAQAGLESDVLLLPHHGSVCPSTDKFLQAVNADVLIRSSNQLTAETTNGLTALVGDTKLYNTADVGALVITIDEFGLHVESWLPNAD